MINGQVKNLKVVIIFLSLLLSTLLSKPEWAVGAGTDPCDGQCDSAEVCQLNDVGNAYECVLPLGTSYFEQSPDQYGQSLDQCREGDDTSLECFQQATLNNTVIGGTCIAVGFGCGEKIPKNAKGGAVGAIGNAIAAMIVNPPASSITYLADLGQNLGIAKPAYAQGFGFAGLNPVLNVWKAFRNLAYLAFILVFIIYGFMIMFRMKINPQTVVSFQTALPKIIMALILVTFSYAIVGLLIDLSYVLIFLTLSFFEASDLINAGSAGQIQNIVFNQNIFKVLFNNFANFVTAPAGAFGEIITNLIGASGGVKTIVGGFFGGLAALIISIALVFVMFKLFFSLLGSYIGIVTSVIFAPIQLLMDVLPGQSGFAGWFMGLIANILVFPATVFMLTLAAVLVGPGTGGNPWGVTNPGYGGAGTGWVPPLLGMQGSQGVAYIPSLIALGMIMMTPKVVDMIKEMFKIKPSMIQPGEALKGPVNVVMGAVSTVGTIKTAFHR